MDYLTQRSPEYINVVVQSFFFGLNLLILLCFVVRRQTLL